MAGDTGEGTVVSEGTSTQSISRFRGTVFKLISGVSTVFGVSVVSLLLLYVANDAIDPLSADPEWVLVFGGAFVVPSLALGGYYLLRDRAAGKVAYETVGVLAVGLILAGGLVIVFVELLTAWGWLSILVALGVAVGVVIGHSRTRPEAAFERLFLWIGAPLVALFGIPAISVDRTITSPLRGTELFTVAFSTPELLPSVRELVFLIPVLPVGWITLVGSITVPAAFVLGSVVAARRDDGRGRTELIVASVPVALFGGLGAPAMGLTSTNGVLIATCLFVPTAAYLEGVIRRRNGLTGLVFPVVLIGGFLATILIADAVGVAGPRSWLDWGYMTSPTTRFNPREAGIYPALVGSILIVLVIALSAFPVGVGAAIYLEEYAPNTGYVGRIVNLIEINIGNLAGVPSIVYGLLGLALFVRGIGLSSGIVVVGGLTIGLLILPIVIISSQEAIRAVPDSMRQASYGMGATRWQTTRNVVLPEALPGIFTGTILALGRAIGETAPLLMIGVASTVRRPPDGFFATTGAMPRQLFSWRSEIEPEFRFGVLAAGVLVLVGVLIIMNGTAIILRNRYQRSD